MLVIALCNASYCVMKLSKNTKGGLLLSARTPFMVARHKNKPPFVVHYLVEIILELVEDRLFGLLVTLEVLAVA